MCRATFEFRILEYRRLLFAPSSISRPEIVQRSKILSVAIISALVSFPTKHKSPAFIFLAAQNKSSLDQFRIVPDAVCDSITDPYNTDANDAVQKQVA